MPDRPAIPADVQRQILIEAGHRCAVCGAECPLERAHIVPWRKSGDHSAENLICLCANCHERADKEGWGEQVLREYKRLPWVHRQRGRESGVPASGAGAPKRIGDAWADDEVLVTLLGEVVAALDAGRSHNLETLVARFPLFEPSQVDRVVKQLVHHGLIVPRSDPILGWRSEFFDVTPAGRASLRTRLGPTTASGVTESGGRRPNRFQVRALLDLCDEVGWHEIRRVLRVVGGGRDLLERADDLSRAGPELEMADLLRDAVHGGAISGAEIISALQQHETNYCLMVLRLLEAEDPAESQEMLSLLEVERATLREPTDPRRGFTHEEAQLIETGRLDPNDEQARRQALHDERERQSAIRRIRFIELLSLSLPPTQGSQESPTSSSKSTSSDIDGIAGAHLLGNLLLLLSDQFGSGSDRGGWGKSNSIFFALTNPRRPFEYGASITQTFWALTALSRARDAHGGWIAEQLAQSFVESHVGNWLPSGDNRDGVSDEKQGRHLSALLLTWMGSSLSSTPSKRVVARLAEPGLAACLVAALDAAAADKGPQSPRTAAARAYMIRALGCLLSAADLPRLGAPCRAALLGEIREDALSVLGASIERLFQPEVWDASTALEDCLNGALQRLLTLLLLRPSQGWYPASWRHRREFADLYSTRLERLLWGLSNRSMGTELPRMDASGPPDLCVGYAAGLCALEAARLGVRGAEQLAQAMIENTRRDFVADDGLLSTGLTWALGVQLELEIGTRIPVVPSQVEAGLREGLPQSLFSPTVLAKTQIVQLIRSRIACSEQPRTWSGAMLRQLNALRRAESCKDAWLEAATYPLLRNMGVAAHDRSGSEPDGSVVAIVLTGASGSGKTTLATELRGHPGVAVASRLQTGAAEGHARDQAEEEAGSQLTSEAEFDDRIQAGELLFDWAVDGVRYGYSRHALRERKDSVMVFSVGPRTDDLDRLVGALETTCSVLVVVLRPEEKELARRLALRYGESLRMKHAARAETFYAALDRLTGPWMALNSSEPVSDLAMKIMNVARAL